MCNSEPRLVTDRSENTVETPTDIHLEQLPLHSSSLLTVLEPDGTIRYESPSISALYGFEQAELVGEAVASYFHPADRKRVVRAFERVVAGQDPSTTEAVEYRHRCADGGYCWVESVASPDPTPAGNYVVNTRDISRQKEREATLERKNERLEEFASIISHDLRNPLTVAKGAVDLLGEQGVEDLDDLEWAHDRMDALIDDVLTLSRMGQQIDTLKPVSLEQVAVECWRGVETNAATLALETNRQIRADRRRLSQLLENLFRNAIEHGGGGGVTVTISDLEQGDGFAVVDDGVGIPPENREMAFESGYSTASEGTGLGLRIVDQIATAHGWTVGLTDSSTGGARFEFSDVEYSSQ